MIPYNATDPFFDSEGDEDKSNPGISLKGEYNRGGTPPSQYTSSPQQNDKRRDEGRSKPERDSTAYSRSSSENFTSESGIMSREKNSAKSYGTYSRSRSRSRSPRSSRSRSRSPTYSDSFNSEDSDQDSRGASPVRNKKSTRGRSNGTSNRFSSGTSKDSRSTFRSYGTTYTKATKIKKKGAPKQGGKGMGRSQSVSTLQQSPRTTEVTRRMLSAKGHTINRLRSDVDELQRKYDNVVRENKLMKQLQRRQEAALAKYDDKEEELPQLLQSHAAEVENLRERLRRTQDREKDKDRRLKEKNEALNKLNDELKKLRQLADDKRLLDRDRLQRKVDKLCDQLDEKERRVAELEKYVDNFKKNVKHDGDNWKHREREYRSRVSYLEEENQNLKYQLREKEKELDIRNIYSHRVLKPPVKLNTSLSPTPRPLAQTRATSNEDLKKNRPPPHPPVKRSSSAEEKKRKSSDAPSPREVEEMLKEEKKSPRKEKKEVEPPPKRELSEEERILQDLDAGFKPHPQPKGDEDDILKDLDAGIQKRERGDEQQRRVEERRMREKEEQEQRQRQKVEEEEKRRKEEKRKEEERRKKEEEERKEKERKQKEEEKKREEEDLASQRRKQKEEADRLAEERKKKDLLLAKMRELDQKPDSRGSKKEYKFTQPIENLHNGKPSHPDLQGSPNSSATKKKPAPPADDAFGSYAPSFGRRAGAGAGDKPPVKTGGLFDDDDDGDVDIFATPKPKQNNNLISNLFGDATATTPNKGRSSFEGTLFSNATKAKPVADSTALPWEKKQQGSLFSQPANKPNGITVNVPKSSFDDFDDDLEEVIL